MKKAYTKIVHILWLWHFEFNELGTTFSPQKSNNRFLIKTHTEACLLSTITFPNAIPYRNHKVRQCHNSRCSLFLEKFKINYISWLQLPSDRGTSRGFCWPLAFSAVTLWGCACPSRSKSWARYTYARAVHITCVFTLSYAKIRHFW